MRYHAEESAEELIKLTSTAAYRDQVRLGGTETMDGHGNTKHLVQRKIP